MDNELKEVELLYRVQQATLNAQEDMIMLARMYINYADENYSIDLK